MRLIRFLLVFGLLLSCSKERTDRNPYLNEIGFQFDINLNLPLYSPLLVTGNAVYIDNGAVGIRGAFVYNSGLQPNPYLAFEASCPNHVPNNCSTMELNGQVVTCPCDGYSYYLANGLMQNPPNDGNRYYNLVNYRTSFNGSNVVVISN